MTPRPLYRWKSFWLGVLVLAFLGWAWVASKRRVEGYTWRPRHIEVTALRGPGYFTLTLARFGTPGRYHRFARVEHELSAECVARVPWFPMAVHWRTFPGGLMLSLAHWLLVVLFLIPWTAFLLWRVRRMKRLAPGGAEPPARSST